MRVDERGCKGGKRGALGGDALPVDPAPRSWAGQESRAFRGRAGEHRCRLHAGSQRADGWGLSGELCAPSIYLAKLKLLSFQELICVTPMEGPGGGLMRHKMMINEFIGRCSSNKGSELACTSGA